MNMTMWNCIKCSAFALCIVVITNLPGAYGSMGEEMAETTSICCNQGTTYARNHSVEDCSSSVPPEVPAVFGSLCIFAMDGCCKEYFQKKKDCETGVDLATSTNQCVNIKDSVKSCCTECVKGTLSGTAKGNSICNPKVRGNSAEELLVRDAFSQCCQKAAKERSGGNKSKSSNQDTNASAKPSGGAAISSLCEEYAPNELCAHHCIPVPGSYKCECNPGFKLMSDGKNCVEVVINRCKPRNPCQHKCNDNGAELKCSCRRGYRLMKDGKSCEDINECSSDPSVCLPGTKCHNIQGSYKCIPLVKSSSTEKGQCPPGFIRNVNNNLCDDVNECKMPHPPCPHYLCENTIGGYKCDGITGDPANLNNDAHKRPADDRCPTGFRMGMNEECEDMDECEIHKDDCNPLSQFCINTRGSYYCQNKVSKHCPPGFKINSITNKCEDIDECEDSEDICRPDQVCINVPGEYDCKLKEDLRSSSTRKCPEGMRMKHGSNYCEDIDECAEGTHLCDLHQSCLNTNGSHECRCKLGFEQDPTTGACVDINECATDQNDCISGSQRCDNTVGSFLCIRFTSCGTGYILHHSTSQCEDIDECALGIHNCARAGPEFHCENHPGSFRCVRKHRSSTSTTPLPEYEYEYYDSDEETEANQTKPGKQPETKPQPQTTSTVNPTEPPSTPSTKPTTDDVPQAVPNRIDSRINNVEPYEPRIPENNEPKYQIQPETPKEVEPSTPYEPRPIEPQQPEPNQQQPEQTVNELAPPEPERTDTTKPEPTEPRPETTTPVPSKPSMATNDASPKPPQIVYVDAGKETATIKGEKTEDGAVVVDTNNVPKNEWTKVQERPSNCQPGFEIDESGSCYDIDECSTQRHSCSGLTEVCRNTMGGYLCDCAPGFRRDRTGACDLIITSSTTSTTTQSPETTIPSTTERARKFFWGYPEYRPATSRPFRPRTLCDVGFHLNSQTGKCEDINECTNGQANCAVVEICVNTEGGYRCECPPNWRLDEVRHRCVPIKNNGQFPTGYGNAPVYSPENSEDAHQHQVYTGTKYVEPEVKKLENRGSVITCPNGYKLGYDNTCEDIDECSSGQAVCGAMQCTNLPGGYVCSCPQGHKLVDGNVCEDVDECSLEGSTPICSQHAECVNTVGSFQCKCHSGFRSAQVNDKVCVDVDECMESSSGSLCQQRCNNVWGGYRCSCHRGYRLNADNRTCNDVDECSEFKHKILCVGHCVNEPGSYRCTCPNGYRLSEDKRNCIDIDECETGEAPCSGTSATYGGTSEVCLNTRGGYRCQRVSCPQGYKLENNHRCTRIEKVCPPADWQCAHQPTTYSYNFITFVSKLYVPDSNVALFTMRGPPWTNAKMLFQLRLVDVNAPPSVKEKADINTFLLVQSGNQAVMSLVRSLEGPQSIELELSMELYNGELFGGIAVAKLFIYVSEYEF